MWWPWSWELNVAARLCTSPFLTLLKSSNVLSECWFENGGKRIRVEFFRFFSNNTTQNFYVPRFLLKQQYSHVLSLRGYEPRQVLSFALKWKYKIQCEIENKVDLLHNSMFKEPTQPFCGWENAMLMEKVAIPVSKGPTQKPWPCPFFRRFKDNYACQ